MYNTIGETIRRLRRGSGMTQEKLAEHLGVSINAVSKWERGECMPDISLLVPLAKLFRITTDELLGYKRQSQDEIVERWIVEDRERFEASAAPESRREYEEWKRTSLEKLLTDSPDDCRLLNFYLGCLSFENDGAEIERICLFLIDRSGERHIVNGAASKLAKLYRQRGDTASAEKILQETFTGLELLSELAALHHGTPRQWECKREYVYALVCELSITLSELAYRAETFEECRELFEKNLAVLDGLTSAGDEGYFRKAWYEPVYFAMCTAFSQKFGRTEEAADALRNCLACYDDCGRLPAPYIHRSGFFAGWQIPERYGFGADVHRRELAWLKEFLRTSPEYAELLSE